MADTYTLPIVKQDEEKQEHLLAEIGDSGLKRFGGLIDEEWHPDLRGTRAVKVFREMADNDPIIGGTLYIIEMLLRQTPWRVEPADDSPQAKEVADFIAEAIEDIEGGFGGFMTEMLTSLTFGWSYHEKLFKRRLGPDSPVPQLRSRYNDGRIGWRKWPLRGQDSLERWHLDDHGEVLGMVQTAPPKYESKEIPRSKALHFRLRKFKNNPEGYSLLRPIYTTYYLKKNVQIFEAIGIERNLAGMPVMQLPPEVMHPNADPAQRAIRSQYETMIRRIKMDENYGIVIPAEVGRDNNPTGYKFDLASSGGDKPADANPVVQRYDSRIAMAMLTQWLLLGQDKVGSFALASNNTDMMAIGLGTVLDMRDEEINEHAIPELVSLNGWPAELAPMLVHGDIETPDLQQLAQYVTALAGSGALVVDDKLEEHLRDLGSLPQREHSSPRPVTQPAQIFGVDDSGQGELF